MINVKENFKSMYQNQNLLCKLCQNENETQYHLLECEKLIEMCSELYNDEIVNSNDIFGDLPKQIRAAKLYEKVLEVRENLIQKSKEESSDIR